MPDKWPLANGNWSNAANWNGGTKPVAGDDVFADGRTVTVDESFTVATLRTTQRSGGTVGGTFLFNTSGVTGNVTSSTPIFISSGTTLAQITAATGTISLTVGGSVALSAFSNTTFVSHTGSCDFNLSGTSFSAGSSGSSSMGNNICISKTSTGTITIVGNIFGGQSGTGSNVFGFSSNAGNTVITGNATAASGNFLGIVFAAVNQTAGNLTITGNVTGVATSSTGNHGIAFSGAGNLTVNGTVLAGSSGSCVGISSSTNGIVTINGTITGGSVAGFVTSSPINNINGNITASSTATSVSSSSANIINVTGTVTASSAFAAISSTNANGQVYLNGNMVNVNGKMAIFAPIVWLDRTGTTSAAFFTSGGVARTLYSADTVPNTPAANNVRSGTIYGAGNSLVGTIVMPVAANVRNGVVYDNGTTGTALFTTSLFLTELSSSTVPVAVRMQNLCTPMILGELMEAFKK